MKRRALLAGMSSATVAFAGCLIGDADERTGSESDARAGADRDGDRGGGGGDGESDPVEYERCDHRIVYLRALPDPAEEEARAALEDGTYETDDPVLPTVIDVDDAYLKYGGGDGGDYYAVAVEPGESEPLLRIEGANPPARQTVPLRNGTDDDATVDVRIEYETESELLVDETVALEPEERIEFDDADYRYGSYRAEFAAAVAGDELTDEFRWRFDYPPVDIGFSVGTDRDTGEPSIHVSEGYGDPDGCEWNEEGELVYG